MAGRSPSGGIFGRNCFVEDLVFPTSRRTMPGMKDQARRDEQTVQIATWLAAFVLAIVLLIVLSVIY